MYMHVYINAEQSLRVFERFVKKIAESNGHPVDLKYLGKKNVYINGTYICNIFSLRLWCL